MRKQLALVALAGVLAASPVFSVAGVPDHVGAATLLVPLFEVGINVATDPEDTLLVVWNKRSLVTTLVHYQVWDINGVPVFNGNLSMSPGAGWNTSLRDLIGPLSATVRTALTDGVFYRGFITFDVVTAPTSLPPTNAAYPFGTDNALEGFIYYVRLPEGSANGLSMVPIEEVGSGVDIYLRGFYQNDTREEIDVDARACVQQLAAELTCDGDTSDSVYRIHQRVFGSGPLGGSTRLVLFTWTLGRTGGPSIVCGDGSCPTTYQYKRYDDFGVEVTSEMKRLDHVVNIFDFTPATPGFASWWEVASWAESTQVYAFSFNGASPGFNPALTWDAIFESYIEP